MNKIKISKLNETIYHERLDNGLNVYIYSKKGFKKKTASLTTKYGSYNNEFKFTEKDEFKSYPQGIAHFLEHKLFESSDHEHVFAKYRKFGAFVNAYTSHNETSYHFVTSNHFFKCLNLLLDFVWSPYFTDENVEKEKGIIIQEINMTDDSLSRFIYERSFKNLLHVNPNKYRTIGTKESVESITKEDLYECYSAFYHPSNMILTISGDIDVKKTIKEIKNNMLNKKIFSDKKIILPDYKEPYDVVKKYEHIKRNVVTPRICVNYKFIFPKLNSTNAFIRLNLFSFLLDIKFGSTTQFKQELIDNEIIKSSFSFDYEIFDDVVLLSFTSDVIDKEKFIEVLDERLKDENYDEYIFDLVKRAYLASMVRMYENPKAVVDKVQRDIIKYGKIITNSYEIVKDYDFNTFIEDVKKLDFSNKAVIYITSSKED